MKKIFYSFVLFFALVKPCQAQVIEQDSLAALDLYNSNFAGGIYPPPSGPVTSWRYLGIGVTGDRITSLSIAPPIFQGPLFLGSVANLTALKTLSASGCGMMCSVSSPSFASNLDSLEEISLSGFNFSPLDVASFMEPLLSMTNLKKVSFTSFAAVCCGRLTGSIPAAISNMTNLRTLDLSGNSITGIDSVFNCPNLESFIFTSNLMAGSIPATIGNCTTLKYLNIFDNEMTGTIPGSIGNCTQLRVLNTSGGNNFTGEIPASITNCTNLSTLILPGNFTGVNPIIQNIGLFTNMDTLQMTQNVSQTPHRIPDAIGRLSRLSRLSLTGMGFSGSTITDSISNCTNLKYVDLSGCNFTGTLPEHIGNLTNLTGLYLYNNSLTGPIPPSIFNLNSSISFNLSSNRFTFDGLEQLKQHFTFLASSPQPNISIRYYGNRLSVSAGGTLANNTYKWYKGGILYQTVTGDSTLSTTEKGIYYAEVTNSIVTGLTLTSGSIYVPLKLCPPAASVSLTSSYVSGSSFQWQMNDGTGYVNISDNANFSGTTTPFLELINIPSAFNGYQFRCFVSNSYYSNAEPIKFETLWTGASSSNWEDAANWNCSAIPDSGTDVVITSGTVVVNSNTTIRSLFLAPGASLTVSPGITLTVLH